MRIAEAARRLGTTPRILRYREDLGLLPVVRRQARRTPAHRQFTAADLAVVELALSIERRYDVSPAALSFGVRTIADHSVRREVAELAHRLGRIPAPAARAVDFEKERAQRLLGLPTGRRAPASAGRAD